MSDFNKSLIACMIGLFLVIIAGSFTTTYLDRNVKSFNQIIDMSGKQRMLSQRIILKSVLLNKDNVINDPDSYKKVWGEYLDALNELIEINSRLNAYHNDIPRLQDYMVKISTRSFNDDLTSADVVSSFIAVAAAYGETIGQGENLDGNQALQGQLQDMNDDVLAVFIDKTQAYRDFSSKKFEKRTIIRLIFVVFFTILIFLIVIITFYPMRKKLLLMLDDNEAQKEEYQTEKTRLDMALEGTSTGIWDWTIDTDHMHWNNVLKDILNIEDHDNNFTSKDFIACIHLDDEKDFINKLVQHLKDGQQLEHECRVKRGDGKYIWVRILGKVLSYNVDNKADRMSGSVIDITKQKEFELRNDIFLQGIKLANIPFAIIDWNDDSRCFSYASPALCQLTGYEESQILKSNMNMFTGPETSMAVLDKIDYALSEQKVLETKILNYNSQGQPFWNDILVQPIFNNLGQFTEKYIVIFNDLTEYLSNQKKEVERQRKESLGSLAGSVAHEINNLLMPMSMARDILEDELKEDCDPFAREQLNTIVNYATQAKDIVNGILTFSRKETVELQKVNVNDEIRSSIQFIEGLLSEKTKLEYEPPSAQDSDIEVMLNKTEMKQIITNLCRNSEQAFENQKGEIIVSYKTVKLSAQQKDDLDVMSSHCVEVSVADNGQGIKEEHLTKIFEPLFTTKDVGQGTGLGLSVVIGIVQSWGGNASVDSVLGKGTTIKLYIPVYKAEEDYSDLEELMKDL